MQNNYYHNGKTLFENDNKKKITQIANTNTKGVVDINILLNRVRIEEKNEAKRKIIFFSFITFALTLFGTFISIIK